MPADNDNLLPAPPALPEPTLFDSTSVEAGRVDARYARVRYMQILQHNDVRITLKTMSDACPMRPIRRSQYEWVSRYTSPRPRIFDPTDIRAIFPLKPPQNHPPVQ